jgi:hypothetical protein
MGLSPAPASEKLSEPDLPARTAATKASFATRPQDGARVTVRQSRRRGGGHPLRPRSPPFATGWSAYFGGSGSEEVGTVLPD